MYFGVQDRLFARLGENLDSRRIPDKQTGLGFTSFVTSVSHGHLLDKHPGKDSFERISNDCWIRPAIETGIGVYLMKEIYRRPKNAS